ncbi:MAG: M23 family metallopeptidase [Solirubrobacterales bacterium]|nr:M23 family metallopeptidase [Solirubrobacterales bacterium]
MALIRGKTARTLITLCVALLVAITPVTTALADSGGASPGDQPGHKIKQPDQESGGIVPGQPKPRSKKKASKKKTTKKKSSKKKKTVPKKPTVAPPVITASFPVWGVTWTYGDADMRFGAGRSGHIHQGQDVADAEGTPIVAPKAGEVSWTSFQEGGAGYYLVLRGTDNRDYVFMHLQKGSLKVRIGSIVKAGQRLASMGNTGHSSGSHLHFEIWLGGWYEKGGHPIDPLPQMKAWEKLPRRA